MEVSDLIDMANVIIQAVQGGADEYDIAKQLNKLYTAGKQEGVNNLADALKVAK